MHLEYMKKKHAWWEWSLWNLHGLESCMYFHFHWLKWWQKWVLCCASPAQKQCWSWVLAYGLSKWRIELHFLECWAPCLKQPKFYQKPLSASQRQKLHQKLFPWFVSDHLLPFLVSFSLAFLGFPPELLCSSLLHSLCLLYPPKKQLPCVKHHLRITF